MINPNAYFTVQAWMVNDLELHGNELTLYAIIYGFSQDGRSEFVGSISYIMEWLGCSRPTAIKALANLVEKGLIIKRVATNGIDSNGYKAVLNLSEGRQNSLPGVVKNFNEGRQNSLPGVVKNFNEGRQNSLPNNYLDNNTDNYLDKENKDGAGAPPAPPVKKKKEKETPAKIVHGHFQHVLLTEDEYAKLVKTYGQNVAAAAIRFLDEYMEDKPKYKSASHYLAIRRWVIDALNEKARKSGPARPAVRGGYPGAMVGPNGIPIDPTKNDLDGQF
jgi:hypothetical protein